MAVHVVDRLVEAVHHLDRHLQAEVLGVPVLLGRVDQPVAAAARERARARVDDAARRPRREASSNSSGSTAGAMSRVHQQRLGRVAHARALDLRVVGDPPRHLGSARRVDVDVAVAGGRVDHRHGRALLQDLLQALAAARDHRSTRPSWRASSTSSSRPPPGDQRDRALGQAGPLARLGDDLAPAPRSSAAPSTSRAARPRCRT